MKSLKCALGFHDIKSKQVSVDDTWWQPEVDMYIEQWKDNEAAMFASIAGFYNYVNLGPRGWSVQRYQDECKRCDYKGIISTLHCKTGYNSVLWDYVGKKLGRDVKPIYGGVIDIDISQTTIINLPKVMDINNIEVKQ